MKLHFACRQSGGKMERCTNAELVDMHLAYGTADCNGRAAQRLYAQRYTRRQTPSHAFFARLHQRLSDSGSFIVDTQQRERRVRTPSNEETVLDMVQKNPGTSTRAVASHVGIFHMTVWGSCVLTACTPVTTSVCSHWTKTILLLVWYLEMRARDPRFPGAVLFTDLHPGGNVQFT
ncbi:hypothetical protein AVEN_250221-1 [Araneus ventricosus]|uniref:DUF4817 domain-containing protein n=1 Tax=Araneus ventricosus TaxID=182803 RepID=A0A4Y2FEA8_ARAVE|nr:hypothetical protein AVEN_250221-1 [Araneus ventricosus]